MHALVLAMLPAVFTAAGVGDTWQVTTHSIAVSPQRVRLAQLDDDGVPDLVFTAGPKAPQQLNYLAVWLNRGNGRFDRHWSTELLSHIGSNGVSLETADLNEDGLTDVALGNANPNGGIRFLPGDGSGRFPEQVVWSGFGGAVDDITLIDYDADGHLDFGTTVLDNFYFLDRFGGDGTGNFGTILWSSNYGSSGGVIQELASGDVSGDGLGDDIVSGDFGLWFVERPPGGQSGTGTQVLNEPVDRAVVADLNGDGLADVAATAPVDHSVQVLHSLGDGLFEPVAVVPTGRTPAGLTALDLDLDGDLDLAATNAGMRSVSLLINDGDGGFVEQSRVGVGLNPIDVAAADLDQDGDADLVVANAGNNSLSVMLNPHR